MEKVNDYWVRAVEKANEELAELYAERDERSAELEQINERILQREKVVNSLRPLAANEVSRPSAAKVGGIAALSLATAVRAILQTIQTLQTARSIRDILDASGYDLKQHANALASVHGILKRLYESGEAVMMESEGKTFYRIASLKPSRVARNHGRDTAVNAMRPLTRGEAREDGESATEELLERFKRPKERNSLQELAKKKD